MDDSPGASDAPVSADLRVTMVKKRLKNGEPCRKCAQAEDMLRRRELWEQIDEVSIADENDAASAGMLLAKKHAVDVAPFFIVEEAGKTRVYDSAIKVAKEVLKKKKEGGGASRSPAETTSSDDDLAKPAVADNLVKGPAPQPNPLNERVALDLAQSLSGASPPKIVEAVLRRLGSQATIAFSGAEDVALIDMAAKSGHDFSVFCLDTGRLHPETYRFIDTVRQYYGLDLEIVSPNFVSLQDLVRKKGLFSFYEDGHTECCSIRKLEPLRRTLSGYAGWITGQRRDQSPTRFDVPEVAWDTSHVPGGLLKANPLAALSSQQVWEYIRENDVPYNELHDRGFVSIGCEPCTRARRPGEHERAARWWWEDETKRECGLHVDGD